MTEGESFLPRHTFEMVPDLPSPRSCVDDIKQLQSSGGDSLSATEKNILGNDLPALWDLVSSPSFTAARPGQRGGRIDFILDNAGFELFCDCIYADFLIQSGLASSIRFHGKRFAW